MLAVPPGYASPLWPPAGLALAAVLLWGPRCAIGIALGSLLLNMQVGLHVDIEVSRASLAVVALLIGMGAALQALGARWLVLCFTAPPWRFDTARQIFAVNLLGGALGSLVNAVLGNLVLLAFNLQSLHALPYGGFNWWVGDTLGVLFFTSLLLILASPRQEVRLWRKGWIATPMLLMFLLVTVLFATAQQAERNRVIERLRTESGDIMSGMQAQITTALNALSSLHRFYDASEFVSREEFNQFTASILATTPSLAALEWIPEIPLARREAIEQAARGDGLHDFRIVELNADNRLQPASPRPLYFPVLYVEPLQPNRKALGLDLGANAERRQVIDRARTSGQLAASSLIHLVQDSQPNPAVLVFESVPRTRGSQGPGLLLEIIRMATLVDSLMPLSRERSLHFTLFDPRQQPVVNQSGELFQPLPPQEARATRVVHTLKLADQEWTAVFPLTPHYLQKNATWQVWMVLAGGMVISALLGNLLMIITGHQAATERTVELRTLELQQQKQELEQTRNALQKANEHKTIFLANMSHELRTPLNSVIGFTRRLLNTASDRLTPRESDGLTAVLNNGRQLLNLINDLLDLSIIEAGKVELRCETLDLVAQLRLICQGLEHDCQDKGIALHTRFAVASLPLHTDPVRLTQIITNLLANAIKYTDSGSVTLTLELLRDNSQPCCRISVIDTGGGIPDDIRNTLFVAFTRAREVQRKTIQGSGLGLSIAAMLTTLLGGTIGVESHPGQGSTFHVQFPLTRLEDAPE